jgi:DNA-binding MarR family transcriptional regulator
LARRSDPQTSHDAAARAQETVSDLELQVLACLILYGPLTSHAIAAYIERSLVAVSPRMKPLEQRGLVVRAGTDARRTLWEVTPRAVWTTTRKQCNPTI